MPCRVNRARLWQGRLLLEWYASKGAIFATLTYKDPPEGGSLVKSDLQGFFKRLRAAGRTFRYYAVGEYGEQSLRPHYHALLFGLSVFDEAIITEKWGLGFVQVSEFTPARALYVSKYITKFDTRELGDRVPPFSLQSRNPPIGGRAVDQNIGLVVHSQSGAAAFGRSGDVPLNFRLENKTYLLGRTLTQRLRERSGYEDVATKRLRQEKHKLAKWEEKKRVGVLALEVKRQAKAASLEERCRIRRPGKL